MRLRGQLDWTDYFKAHLLHVFAGATTIGIAVTAIFFGCLTAGGLLMLVSGNPSGVLVLPLIFLLVGGLAWRYVFLPRQVRRVFSQQKELQLPFEMEIGDAGLLFANELGRNQRPWNMFVKWNENQEMLMLYLSDVAFVLIPKRLVPEPGQVEAIKAYLRSNGVPSVTRQRGSIRRVVVIVIVLVAIGVLLWMVRSTTPNP